MRKVSKYLLLCFLLLFLLPVHATEVKTKIDKTGSAYCGIYCMYAVMKINNINAELPELIKPEYISSPKGSSLSDLGNVAQKYGLYAESIGKLTTTDLKTISLPAILHVKSNASQKKYDHYELFLGTENGKAKLFNPTEPVKLVAFAQLAPRWDGNGLVVSAQSIDLSSIFAPARKRLTTYAAIVVAVILSVRWARRWLPKAMLNSRGKLFGLSVA